MSCLTWSPSGVPGHLLGKPRGTGLRKQRLLWKMGREASNPRRLWGRQVYRRHGVSPIQWLWVLPGLSHGHLLAGRRSSHVPKTRTFNSM